MELMGFSVVASSNYDDLGPFTVSTMMMPCYYLQAAHAIVKS